MIYPWKLMEPVNFQMAVEEKAVWSADLYTDSLMRLPIDLLPWDIKSQFLHDPYHAVCFHRSLGLRNNIGG